MSRVDDAEGNADLCICPDCPSYPDGCEGEVLYCARGKSDCRIDVEGCFCVGCPVWGKYDLDGLYFCDRESVTPEVYMRQRRPDESPGFYEEIVEIKQRATTGKSVVSPMGSRKEIPFTLDRIHFLPAQVKKFPLNEDEEVDTSVTFGSSADEPVELPTPLMVSGMSFGAVSKKVKVAIAEASTSRGFGFNSGEGGLLEEDLGAASENLIAQYSTGRFGIDEDSLGRAAGIELRFGQRAYPGKGSYLPPEKVTEEVAEMRGLDEEEGSRSPARHPDISGREDVEKKVSWLRGLTDGPVGAKIGCGNVEGDLEALVESDVDFVALDGFGGGTGATYRHVRENVGLPLVAALPRADDYLRQVGARGEITLIGGGGLRTAPDFAKCLALGADAVYVGTAALIALGCEQYRICQTDKCPTGVTTHEEHLTDQMDVGDAAERLSNFIEVLTRELADFARVTGKEEVGALDRSDLASLDPRLSEMTGVGWLDGEIRGDPGR